MRADTLTAVEAPTPLPVPGDEHLGTVLVNATVNARYKHLVVSAPEAARAIRPGQFFNLLCPPLPDEAVFLRRPMSVYQMHPNGGTVEFLYHVTGAGTRALAHLAPGDTLNMLGPLGLGFSLDPAWRRIVVLARGVGLATLAPLAQMAQASGVSITAILSARSKTDLMSQSVFADAGAEVLTVTDEEGTSAVPRVETLLVELIRAGRADAFFTCGSNRLLKLLQTLGRAHGIGGQVAIEQQMACGLGMCFCCVRQIERNGTVANLRVCRDGPVFGLHEALSW